METEFDALSVESDEESAGALIRRSSKVKSGRILKENDETTTLKMEAEAGEVSSLFRNVEVAENTAKNSKDNCRHGEVRTGKMEEVEPSERTFFEENVCREKEEFLGGEVSSGHFLSTISSTDTAVPSTISSNVTAVPTMSTNSTEADMTQPKALSEWSESVVKDEGLWKCRHCSWIYPVTYPRVELIQKHKEHCETMNTIQVLSEEGSAVKHKIVEGSEGRAILDKEGAVIDCENKDTELVQDKVTQTMTEVKVNQTSVSEIIMQNSQDGFVRAQDETQLSDHWSRTLENSASIGKVEEIVNVLKEQQSHDLLCPVCGSCITKRVILRKRKRVSTVSVDRWINEPDDNTQAALIEGRQQTTGDESDQPEIEYSDGTDAYGCLACFSIFFRRVVDVPHLLTKSGSVKKRLADQDPSSVLQDTRDISDKDKESFYCLPFRNPWPKNSKKEPIPAAAEEQRSSSNDVKDSHDIATQSISYPTSITETETETVLSSMENVGSKISKHTLTEGTNITESDKSLHLTEQFTPAELHLGDSARLHAKHEEQEEQAKTEATDEDISINLQDVGPSNIQTSIQANVGSKNTKYTVTQAAEELRRSSSNDVKDSHAIATQSIRYQSSITETEKKKFFSSVENEGSKISKYTPTEATDITRSDKSSHLKEQYTPAERSEDQLSGLHLDDSAKLHAKHEEKEEQAKTEPDVLPSNIKISIQEHVGSKKTKDTVTEATDITHYVNQSDKSSRSKVQFSPAKRPELHLDDPRLHAKREEQEHANTKTPHGSVSKILPDALTSNIEKNMPEQQSATHDRESHDFSTVQRDAELQRDISYKTDYTCNCIPISIQRVWSIWSLKGSIPDQQLKDPLLAKEKLEENVSMLPDGSVSHDILQSNKVLIRSQPPDDKESEATSPLLSAGVKSNGRLIKRDPILLHSEEPAISTDPSVSPVQTVIEIEPAIDDSQPSGVATTVSELTRTPAPQPQPTQIVAEWDILKSIVYGGLTVSLTSLGVVSSTAGGEAKTLTVIAIGFSNLVAGLFVILNNMLDLDHYHRDQFIERVGHSPWFNGSVAIVSYLIFGSLAPVTYAFSFRKTDNKIYKFIITSAASLVCIILLALGKARISKKSYIRTVTLYIVTGFWSAVVGFFAGEYIKKLLEKWGL